MPSKKSFACSWKHFTERISYERNVELSHADVAWPQPGTVETSSLSNCEKQCECLIPCQLKGMEMFEDWAVLEGCIATFQSQLMH